MAASDRTSGVDPGRLQAYLSRRPARDTSSLCNAPASNMYFSASGRVAPCWIQLGQSSEMWGPGRSVLDIWNGPQFSHLRDELAQGRFPGSCRRCADDIDTGLQPLAAVYDRDAELIGLPTSLELELSNLCNFECVMCHGDLSSRIRRNRERRAPLHSPYDSTFVDQITELLPGLKQVRFSGGEPMLHPLVHDLAGRIGSARPDLRIDISTNGSVLNGRVRRLLEAADVQVNVSFESLIAERYEAIRVGSDFSVLMENLDAFQEHFRTHPGLLTVNTNPMRSNWDEMPAFVRWCDEREIFLTFNEVIRPVELALHSLPAADLHRIGQTMAADGADLMPADGDGPVERHNHGGFADLLGRIDRWRAEAEERDRPTAVAVRAGAPAAAPLPPAAVPVEIRPVPAPLAAAGGTPPDAACHAPFTSMFLDQHGNARACCQSNHILGNVATSTLDEIWHGEPAAQLRSALSAGDLSLGCQFCEWATDHGGAEHAFARRFDHLPVAGVEEGPVQLEMALSNTCNLQCTMCSGEFSSSIRSQREHLPPLPPRYGEPFFAQLEAVLPRLVQVELFGGEPILARESLRVLEMLEAHAPEVEVRVTTNGTIWNDRIQHLAEHLPLSFVVSVDGVSAETYESIRVGASWEQVRDRLDHLVALTEERGTTLAISHCLMVQNWWELPDLLRFCAGRGVQLWINTVRFPTAHSLFALPPSGMDLVVQALEQHDAEMRALPARWAEVWDAQLRQLRSVLDAGGQADGPGLDEVLAAGRLMVAEATGAPHLRLVRDVAGLPAVDPGAPPADLVAPLLPHPGPDPSTPGEVCVVGPPEAPYVQRRTLVADGREAVTILIEQAPLPGDRELLERLSAEAAPGAPVVTLVLTPDGMLRDPLPAADVAAQLGMVARAGAPCRSPLDVLLADHTATPPEIREVDDGGQRVEVRCTTGLVLIAYLSRHLGGRYDGSVRIHVTAARLPAPVAAGTP